MPTGTGSPPSPRTRPGASWPTWSCGTAAEPAARTASGAPRTPVWPTSRCTTSPKPDLVRHRRDRLRAHRLAADPGSGRAPGPSVGAQAATAAAVLRCRPARHLGPSSRPARRRARSLERPAPHRRHDAASTCGAGLSFVLARPDKPVLPAGGSRRPPETGLGRLSYVDARLNPSSPVASPEPSSAEEARKIRAKGRGRPRRRLPPVGSSRS